MAAEPSLAPAPTKPEPGPPTSARPDPAIASQHGRRDYVLRRALALADCCAVMAAVLTAFVLTPISPSDARPEDAVWMLLVLPAWLVLFRLYGLYDRDVKRISHSVLDDLPSLFHAFVLGTLISWVAYSLFPVHRIVFVEAGILGVTGIVWATLFRELTRRLLARFWGPERVILVGSSPRTGVLLRKIRSHPEYALEPIGVVTVDGSIGTNGDLPILGNISRTSRDGTGVTEVLAEHEAERLIIAAEQVDDETLFALVQSAGRGGVKVGILPRHLDALGPSLQVDEVEGLTVLELNPLVLPRFSRMAKRAMDILGSGLALLIASPFMALMAVAIKVTSRGPVFFRQNRIGKESRDFTLYKFRTMVPGAEQQQEELREGSDDPNWVKIDNDPRVTSVGRFLRHWSLDELPQLWNVVKGDMSLVGPRPLIGSEDELITGWARTRLDLSPGLTGLWQVLGRTTIPFDEMVKLDYLYVTNWSLWGDFKLVFRTVPVVLRRRGAN